MTLHDFWTTCLVIFRIRQNTVDEPDGRLPVVESGGSPLSKRGKAFDLDVIVDVVFDDGLLFLRLSNIGTRPARDVSVRFEPAELWTQ